MVKRFILLLGPKGLIKVQKRHHVAKGPEKLKGKNLFSRIYYIFTETGQILQ
jgi:hypothetical protein